MALTPGSNLGPYRIVEPLGRGGMASVYRAYEPGLDRYVALKVLPAEFLHDPAFAQRFDREAKLIARLEHAHVVPIYAYGIDQGIPWMAMRLVAGGSASALLRSGRIETARVVAILRGVAAALDYAHVQGVLHRDVKPANVLLDGDHVYLADFGIARMVEGSPVLTRTGMIAGTPQYMAPEQAQGAADLGPGCDIYALGVMAYEMLTGRVPFDADTPVAVLMKHVLEPVPLPALPEPQVRALLQCLAKNPGDRWSSALAFVQALEEGLGETPVVARTPAYPDRPTEATALTRPAGPPPVTRQPETATVVRPARLPPPRPKRLAVAALGAAVVVVGAILAVFAFRDRQAAPESPSAATPSPLPGIQLVLRAATEDDATLAQLVAILRRRAEQVGAVGPVVSRRPGAARDVVVQLPGIVESTRAARILTTPGHLSLQLVEDEASSREALLQSRGGKPPDGLEVQPGAGPEAGQTVYYLLRKEAAITEADLSDARVVQDELGAPSVSFSLSPEGAARFGRFTGSHIGRRLAILLDGRVESAPVIQSRITGEGRITGRFDEAEARDLAGVLRSGALPVAVELLEVDSLRPTKSR